jgi:hypothetical protein
MGHLLLLGAVAASGRPRPMELEAPAGLIASPRSVFLSQSASPPFPTLSVGSVGTFSSGKAQQSLSSRLWCPTAFCKVLESGREVPPDYLLAAFACSLFAKSCGAPGSKEANEQSLAAPLIMGGTSYASNKTVMSFPYIKVHQYTF